MTDPAAFLLACLALLAAPGPTNALLAAAGARLGLGRALPAVPAAVAGYAIAIAALVGLAGPTVAAAPLFAAALKAAAGAYLIHAAVRLWRTGAGAADAEAPGVGAVFTTTLLNPKSLVFAFAILPQRPLADLLVPDLALIALSIAVVSCGWIAAGAALGRGGRLATPARVSRVSAVVLATFAVLLAADATRAVAAHVRLTAATPSAGGAALPSPVDRPLLTAAV